METEHCIKEEVPADACCQAKRDGKNGVGLEDACTTLTITPSGGDAAPEAPMDMSEPEEPEMMEPEEPETQPDEPAEETPEDMPEAEEPETE